MAITDIAFTVTHLSAEADGIPVRWQGREFPSGRLRIELDDTRVSGGSLDYARRHAAADMHIRLHFPELAALLADLEVDARFTEPVRAVVRSRGDILDDHAFRLSGDVELAPHALVSTDDRASARVLPGR